ncbi:helix-turn-helix transcriptional regulator [Ruicaihuangia caeni]|uniref:Helix-turn-helix domain-containing protein n=1 Tax=Ruicaihuangia caeni TaxID=3042517 RepID=A0AAW6T798_9MICO|nr:helix-turn-helix domain-containing protein [Klugiella sp. YN-L-19]MDI2098003.1 helix-turn-helix domain-containing protein [Klugiella sp. YN-L-19]
MATRQGVPPLDRLLTVREAAARLNRTEAALRFQIYQGTAPRSAKIGGRRMFRESDIESWIIAAFEGREAH